MGAIFILFCGTKTFLLTVSVSPVHFKKDAIALKLVKKNVTLDSGAGILRGRG